MSQVNVTASRNTISPLIVHTVRPLVDQGTRHIFRISTKDQSTSTDNKQPLPAITLTAIGVAYDDIGTSPLHTLHECLSGQFGFGVERDAMFGFLSLIFWLLVFMVSIKYLTSVMWADSAGEGGILTLMSLARRSTSVRATSMLVIMGLIGGSFFYGGVVITPATSAMSVIEGLKTITPQLDTWIAPPPVITPTLLFMIQKHGAAMAGKLFAPITLTWSLALTGLGLRSVIASPEVLRVLNPMWAIHFFLEYKAVSPITLGTVVLSTTGVKTPYTDMRHFGRSLIRLAWFTIVLPFLTLNYFGQETLLLRNPEAIKDSLLLLAPDWALIPLLIIVALATMVASQAIISSAFSLTRQAVRLGYLSPMYIIHTSEIESGQIYIPFMNWMPYVVVAIVIVSLEHSNNLAAAYGTAVTGTMVLTSTLSATIACQNWHWNKYFVTLTLITFLCVDIPLFTASFDKLLSGGWLPLSLGTVMFIVVATWKSECFRSLQRMHEHGNSLEAVIASLEKSPSVCVSGTAVYISYAINVIPSALMHNLKHNKVPHERVTPLILHTEDVPYVHDVRQVQIEQLSPAFWRVVASYDWRETPNMEEVFRCCGLEGLSCWMMETSFFMSHESLILGKRPWYLHLRGKLYLLLQRSALRTPDQFEIPSNRAIGLGTRVKV